MSSTTMLPEGWKGVYVLYNTNGPLRVYRDMDKAEQDKKLLLSETPNSACRVVPVPMIP